jgi:hypothetical protein
VRVGRQPADLPEIVEIRFPLLRAKAPIALLRRQAVVAPKSYLTRA